MADTETGLGDIERMLELRRVPLFERLDPEDLQRVAAVADERAFTAGTVIVQEGEVGDELFVILDGRVRVERLDPDGSIRPLRTYEAGDHFGELALITEDARTATVTAVTRLTCNVIAFWDFRRFARENPDVSWALLQHLAGLLTGERDRRARASLASS